MKYKSIIITILIGLMAVYWFKDNKDSSQNNNKDIKTRISWVNSEYLNCINESSLNKCFKEFENPMIFLDSLNYVWIECINEYCIYKIKNTKNEHSFITHDSIEYSIRLISEDSLALNNHIYVTNPSWNIYENDILDKLRGDVFKKRYSLYLRDIYNSEDSILLSYNPYWNIHFVKNVNSCKDMYIAEFVNDSVYIYDFEDKCMPLKPQRMKNKKLLLKFQQYFQ